MAEDEEKTKGGTDQARAEAIAKMKQAQQDSGNELEGSSSADDPEAIRSTRVISKEHKKVLDDIEKHSKKNQSIILSNVKIYSPFHTYFDGEADSVSAVNGSGPFDVLPGHKNFLSLLQPCELVVRTKRGEDVFQIDRGVMHVSEDEITVFLDV